MGDGGSKRLIIAAIGSTIAGSGAPAFAQVDDACTDGCPETRPIIVTGSHIAGPENAASPVQRIDSEDIDQTGIVNIQELLNDNPVFGSPAFTRTNSNFATDSAGMGTVNLRNLGESRTLVLLNGRRLVPSIPGTDVVDLSIIPTQLVSRVDVLTGGASSIYGSDAIAGVVNIILDDRFEGLKAEGQMGFTGKGDDIRKQVSITYGTSFAGKRGHLVLHGGFSREGAVFSSRRNRTAESPLDCFTVEGGDPFEKCGVFLSARTPEGTIEAGPFGDPAFTFFGSDVVAGRPQGFNFNIDRLVAVPTRRYLLGALGRFDFSDRLSATFEGSFARNKVDPDLEPLALDSADLFPENGGRFNIEHDVVGPAGTLVRVRNPFVQDAIFDAAVDTDGDGLRDVGFLRRMSEFGNRGADTERETWRVLAGLEGLAFGDWRWNAYYAYGRSTQGQLFHGNFDFTRLRQALLVVPDISDTDHDGDVSEPVCLDPQARAEGCIPANLFGGAGALAPTFPYLHVDATSSSRVTQNLAGATLMGSLAQLPGGALQAAVGAEYRKEHSRQEYDELTQAGLNGLPQLPNLAGGFDVAEGYAELIAPILSGRRLAETLRLRGSVRVANYSTIGTSSNWNYGIEYAPIEAIRFRAVKSRATRAPNIGELFFPQTEFVGGLPDPCKDVTATTPGTRGTVCRSFPGVNANIAQNGQFTVSKVDGSSVTFSFGGNPDLREETSNSLTAGVVVKPFRGLNFTIDYFNIKVSDAIFAVSPDAVLNQCFNEGIEQLCALVTRRATGVNGTSPGSLERVDTRVVNTGGLGVKGVDVTATYGADLLLGRLDLSLAYTHLIDGFVIPVEGGPKDPFAGEIGSSRDRAVATISYDRSKWGLTLRTVYIGPAYLNDQFFGVDRTDKFKLGAETIVDAQLRIKPTERFQFFLGADNLFDNAPPFISVALFGDPGVNTNAATYDAIGRRFYIGARTKF